ncbi:hypothetical protein UFOVP909_222 [uncultured Caudovirales phage]|uniref:EF-hand domain-containing protein n=1 Tax=uncultured Caudovirales phage TaxID=2100421 RepID=A0A6J5RVI6_9CAUD|nr:hypothetical protein UFOVP909_222 [uncultured Caudovirales phage]CAB4181654.1 hypothetical protein UFOVP1066_49 [uncultured Caudovirales phage]CAB4198317.1 hypothetical protein UFOVP1315_66 [uncultured Caudovirales phage]CAB4211366.1 hypothetical protein UFOVP1421_27 [uncultured Caudovirales phage]CAB5238375.1 hypothetical protein UFOVP1525_37 [uncultured Caudovirales phage]
MEYKSFMEALKGKQHKIDKNKNGQIDSHDFKLLRKEEADLFEAGPHDPDFVEKSARHERLYTYHKRMGNDTEAAKHKAEIDKLYKKEETEELDEIHRMKTKLNTLDDISNKSVARQKLSNLMKSGKARGALIANKMRTLNMGEEVEIDETWSKEQLASIHSMHDKMSKSVGLDPSKKYGTIITKKKSSADKVMDKAIKDEMKEEVEQIDEITSNSQILKNALDRHTEHALAANKAGDDEKVKVHQKYINDIKTKLARITRLGEEVEQIEERNKQNAMMRKTMDASRGARYKLNNPVPDAEPEHKTAQAHNKAIGRALRNEDKMTTTKDKAGKLISFKYEGDWKKSTEKKQGSGKAANLAGQAMQKMAKANEQAPVAPVPDRKYIKGTPENKALKDSRKPINGMPTNKIKEEKDEQEYGYEGDMALNQLATLTRCAEMIKEILKPDTDMPEWVQSKITLATDYIQTAADYMHSEMNEAKSVEVKVNAAGDAAHEEKWEAVKKIKKPVKESFDDEGNLIANKVSYKEFMLEYTPGPGGVTQIKGRSYGASYSDPEGADDYDDKKPIKPAAEKRGRGRPAGAKSGARKITGTSKLMNK